MLNHKAQPSRGHRRRSFSRVTSTLGLAAFLLAVLHASALNISHADALRIGKKIWQNECNGTISGLTSWNAGENFASLGIGHFIWYPKDARGPFEESFPKMVSFVSSHGAKLPQFLLAPRELVCPWNSRTEFLHAQQTPQMKQLRQFLADTVDFQAEFLAQRLQEALAKMLAAAEPEMRDHVRERFNHLAESSTGCYALMDYVNFKGEGTNETERYRGQGWGLLQALEGMSGNGNPAHDFAASAKNVLARRVQNSPPERHESRWLSGWQQRINSYTRD
jgi:hypothetical protein